jgi:hypothetical protein
VWFGREISNVSGEHDTDIFSFDSEDGRSMFFKTQSPLYVTTRRHVPKRSHLCM